MNFLLVCLLIHSVAALPFVLEGKQRRWTADEQRAIHRERRKTHEAYEPRWPGAPVVARLSVGTPPRDFRVALETGTTAVFLLGADYPGRLPEQPAFEPARSSSARPAGNFSAFTGNVQVFGAAFDDFVAFPDFGEWANLTQRFGVVDDVEDPYFVDPQMPDGVLGLSWNPDDAAAPSETSAPIVRLFAAFGGLERVFCQWVEGVSEPGAGREFRAATSFGGCLDAVCPPLDAAVPLVWLAAAQSLAFRVDSFAYDGQQFEGDHAKADTGMPNVLVPLEVFDAVYTSVQPDYDFELDLYTVACVRAPFLPDWQLVVGGRKFAIPPAAYVVDLQLGDGRCAWSLYTSDPDTTPFVLGLPFASLFCAKWDLDRQAVGFAPALPQFVW